MEIYSRTNWYLSRLEPEQEWRGVLHRRQVTRGPASRSALTFAFETAEELFPVYAANVEGQLAQFLGLPSIVRGKLVDLRDEGFGQELWIASIQRAN
jgi:hypothetical protein